MSLATTLLSTSEIIMPIISSVAPMIIDVITRKHKEKDEADIDLVIKCFEETQERFAESYNESYIIDDADLFSQILKIYTKDEEKVREGDKIIADIIESSFEVDVTDKMIDEWKSCFNRTICDKKYTNLLSLVKYNNGNLKREDYNGKNLNIFLSYSWKDEKKADEIDTFFSRIGVDIRRDRKSIEQWGNIREFMNSIQDSDYAILIISDAYLKSVNCMYEITQLMKDPQYKDRIFPIVLDDEIYQLKKRIDYIVYWEEKYDEAKKEVARVKNIENAGHLSLELHQIREVSYTVGEFLDIIKDMNNPQTEGINQAIYKRLCEKKLLYKK